MVLSYSNGSCLVKVRLGLHVFLRKQGNGMTATGVVTWTLARAAILLSGNYLETFAVCTAVGASAYTAVWTTANDWKPSRMYHWICRG
ncbi:hypothetical protein Q3G72_015516 [Acer saccharum]|nr:hypothetical protein Q3G72_015516 [Acer saccharum]